MSWLLFFLFKKKKNLFQRFRRAVLLSLTLSFCPRRKKQANSNNLNRRVQKKMEYLNLGNYMYNASKTSSIFLFTHTLCVWLLGVDLKWGVASFFFFCLTHTIKTKQQRDKKKRNNRVNWARKRKKVNKDRGGMRVCVYKWERFVLR